MASAIARFFIPVLATTAPKIAEGAIGLSVLDDTINILESNPIIPIAIGGIVLFIILKKKS